MPPSPSPSSDPVIPRWVVVAGLACAAIPLAVMGVAALAAPAEGARFMGELQYDQFYYLANARALIERGNGFAYPNPYDARDDAPVIYSHLYPLIVGWLWKLTPLSLLAVSYLVRLAGGVALSTGIWRLAGVLFPAAVERHAAFWLVLLGGGAAWAHAVARHVWHGGRAIGWPAFAHLLGQAEPFHGVWLQNVFRNYFYGTETLYHALAFWLLHALASRRQARACVLLALLLHAHPFTGLQFGLITVLWLGGEQLAGREPRFAFPSLVAAALVGAFVFYNAVFLMRFPEHAAVVEFWRLVSVAMPARYYLWIYGPWLLLAAVALGSSWRACWSSGPWRLVVIVLGVTLVLMNNQLYLRPLGQQPVQPIHFARGYEFFPMILLGLRWLCEPGRFPWLVRLLRSPAALAALVAVLALDNVFYVRRVVGECRFAPMTVSAGEAAMVGELARIPGQALVLASSTHVGYLTPTFTSHRTLVGHFALTPDLARRSALMAALRTDAGPLFDAYPGTGLVAVTTGEGDALEAQGMVRADDVIAEHDGQRLYRRRPAAPAGG